MKRKELINKIADEIATIKKTNPLLVAIDGKDAAGKTILATELSEELRKRGKKVIESSVDYFHNPREVRYRRGRDNPDGYYRDSFNIDALKKHLLDPLKRGNLQYRTRFFDYQTDSFTESPHMIAKSDSILVFDGIFSLRPELRPYWDYSVYLNISEDESLCRGVKRDPGDSREVKRMYLVRYNPGQRIYHTECGPMEYASIIVDNNDPNNPKIL